jgi:hypothetical protein
MSSYNRAAMRKLAPVLLLFIFAAHLLAADSKIEQAPAFAGTGAVPEVRKLLETSGYRVVLPEGVACEVWLRASLPPSTTKGQGLLYPELWPSAFVGVVTFPKPFTDFRGQTIKPGSYSLRYELLPEDGNHLGVAPNRDFLLLIPIAAELNPTAQIASQQLINLSQQASGTNHPAVMSLLPAELGAVPSLSQTDEGYWMASLPLKAPAGALRLGLVVKGVGAQ